MSNKIVYTPKPDVEYTFKYWSPKKQKIVLHSFILQDQRNEGEHVRYEFYCTDLKCLTSMRDDRFSYLRAKWYKDEKPVERAVQLEMKMASTPAKYAPVIVKQSDIDESQRKLLNDCLSELNDLSSEEIAAFEIKGFSYIKLSQEIKTAIVNFPTSFKLSYPFYDFIPALEDIKRSRQVV